ncbi:MAG: GAF domain-containing protein, partial [Candidatus Caldatribacteriaceae bacterium]
MSGSLLLKGEEGLVLIAGRNLYPSCFGERIHNSKSVSEMVFKKGMPVIVGGKNSSFYIPMRKREDQFSLSFPILNSDGQVIGVLNLNRDTRSFDKEDIPVAQKIASAIALLLEENTLRRGRERLLLVFSEVVNLFEKKDYLFQEELVYKRIFLAVQLLLEIREGAIFKLSPRRPYLVFSHCWPSKITFPKLEAHFGKEWDESRAKVIDVSWNGHPKKFLLLPIYGNLGWRFLFVSLVKRDLEPLEFLILSMITQLGKSCLDTILLFRQNEKLVQDREKNQLARELHDGLAQILASSQIYLHFLKNNQDPEDERLQKDILEKLESLIRMGIEESRFILSELSGKPVSAFRLRKELEEIINVFACPGLSIHQELKINVRLISFRVFRALTAIVREGLSNVVKHSGAQNVWIHLYNDKQFFFLNI